MSKRLEAGSTISDLGKRREVMHARDEERAVHALVASLHEIFQSQNAPESSETMNNIYSFLVEKNYLLKKALKDQESGWITCRFAHPTKKDIIIIQKNAALEIISIYLDKNESQSLKNEIENSPNHFVLTRHPSQDTLNQECWLLSQDHHFPGT